MTKDGRAGTSKAGQTDGRANGQANGPNRAKIAHSAISKMQIDINERLTPIN